MTLDKSIASLFQQAFFFRLYHQITSQSGSSCELSFTSTLTTEPVTTDPLGFQPDKSTGNVLRDLILHSKVDRAAAAAGNESGWAAGQAAHVQAYAS